MKSKIAITSLSSISALGSEAEEIWQHYLNERTHIRRMEIAGESFLMAQIPESLQKKLQDIRLENAAYQGLDASVIYAIWVARQALAQANWKHGSRFGIHLGSSRGATQSFEKHHQVFLQGGRVSPHASPTTTLGNLSSWIASDLKTQGPEISQSVTCSTGLHAILNAVAWLQSGMETRFLAGASEAALTAFTFHQLNALRIYAKEDAPYPCRAFDLEKTKNSMVLGEGAAIACLDNDPDAKALAYIEAVGYATDEAQSSTALSEQAICFQRSMRMAIAGVDPAEIDVIVMHAPGTIKGDLYEWQAIQSVFQNHVPMCTTNKWKLGHTLGASGMLSLQMAILMLQHQVFIPVPYISVQTPAQTQRKAIRKVLINAVGFGGNAVSILLSR